MTRRLAVGLLAAALAAAGCELDTFSQGAGPRQWPTATGAGAGRSAPPAEEDAYTILLCVLNDPVRHVRDAEAYRKAMTEKVGWKGLFVVHKGGHSELFWGRYGSPADAEKDLRTAKSYRTQTGMPIFAKAIVVPLPGRDIGPEAWRLDKAKGEYSLLVAVFKDVPEKKYVGRRRFAVDYCRRLREHGYPGYFHHGKVVSHVTLGAFARNAVRERKTRQGQQLEILDAGIKKLRADFPELQVNGNTVTDITRDSRTGKVIRSAERQSYLIRIPRGEAGDAG